MNKNITVLKGDGIGPEIVDQAIKVLDAVCKKYSHSFSYTEVDIGGCSIDKHGVPITKEGMEICKSADSVLLGAVGGPKWDNVDPSIRPEKALLAVRSELGLFANLRPTKAEVPELEKTKKHSIDIVIDRLSSDNLDRSRLNDSVELALKHGKGNLTLLIEGENKGEFIESKHSEFLACPDCKISFGKLLPRNFSFNAPYGACPECNGLGVLQVMDENLVVPNRKLSINNGAIPAWRRGPRHLIMYYNMLLRKISEMCTTVVITAKSSTIR